MGTYITYKITSTLSRTLGIVTILKSAPRLLTSGSPGHGGSVKCPPPETPRIPGETKPAQSPAD